MKKRSKRGGKRPGAGRPRKENALTETFSVAVSAADRELLRQLDAGKWAREVLMRSAMRRTK